MGFITHLVSLIVVVVAITFTIFVNYPAPPPSPLLFQWQSTGKNLTFGQHTIFYKDDIRNSDEIPRTTLVCLHGFPTSSLDWYKIWPEVRRKFGRVVVLDFLGLGFSDKPRYHSYTIKEQADIVEALLKTLNIQDIHLLAHDYGDTVAQELVARYNEQSTTISIQSVCLLNGGIFPTTHHPILAQKLLRLPVIGTVLSKWSNYYFFRATLNSVFGPDTGPSPAEFHDLWHQVRHNDGHRVTGDILSYIDQRVKNEERWVGGLKRFKRPLHMIYGPADPVNPPPFQNHFKEHLPEATIDVLDDKIGHYPQMEDPEAVVRSYFAFLKRVGVN